ncbi:LOW QUALITY PROTEIN: tRNA (uracil-5-)-methyltransferase homolog B [Lycaon pictus]
MHSPRCFFSRVGLLSKPRLLHWCATKPPGWSQLFKSLACKGNFTYVIAKKCQRGQKSKKSNHVGPPNGSWQERLAYVVTPLWRLSCEEQIKVKFEAQKKILQRLESYFQKLNGVNVTTSVPRAEGLCCLFHPIISSPVINGYQNKSTFSVNGPDGNTKTMGYYLGTWRIQNIVCVPSNHLKNIPEKHNQYYEVFLQSAMESCFLFHEGGYWCELIFCTDSRGHTMAIITFHPQELRQEELSIQETLKKFFTTGPGAVCDLTSLYFQESTMMHCSHQQSPYQLLFGEPHLFEDLLGLKICISPEAFFQINNAGAEVLYRTVRELVNSNTILLDICCGTSVIGLSLVQYISQVLGINLVEQAVEDARWTAAFNGITNREFHTGRAEKILPQLLQSKENWQFIVAVVSPAQAGLHYQVVQAIQNCRAIRTQIFVSCKPHGETTRNIIRLCCPPNSAKKLFGESFVLRKAVPVDLFSHTMHCKLVLLLTCKSASYDTAGSLLRLKFQ